ncbi:MAG: 3'-5' exonuclease [Pyrinomonadaceae bacterium]
MTRRIVTIDIETLPASEPVVDECLSNGTRKQKDEYEKTALNGDFGRVLCIGYVKEDERGIESSDVLGWDETSERFTCDERAILTEFWHMMQGFRPETDRVVGHNIFDFDLKFIYKRSIVHGVRPTVGLSFARYRSQPIYDTMCEWERWSFGSRIKLDRLARVLSLASSKADGVDGSCVFRLFEQGEHRLIRDYCWRDVELTRAIYRRMVFADLAPARPVGAALSTQGLTANVSM